MERMTGLEPVSWPWRGRALPAELQPQKLQGMPSASTEAALRQLVKERPPHAVVRSIDRWPVPMRKPVESEMKRARILSESGPLRTELGGCTARRSPLPDALGPRSDQADASLSGRPDARRRRRRPAIPSPPSLATSVRTRPDPSWVGWFWRRSGISRWVP